MATLSLRSSIYAFDPDRTRQPAVAIRVEATANDREAPVHHHRKGQLILSLHGSVTCEVPNAQWMVPPQRGIWIPGGTPHSNRATANARLCFLFIEPDAAALPADCCALGLSPMIREMALHLADGPQDYKRGSHTERLVRVLLDELCRMPVERTYLPVSDHPKIRQIATALADDPSDRRTLAEWAAHLALSERSLARLMVKETGLTFGRWRQQRHLLHALRQLSTGEPVQRVAHELGYESVTAFITMFKKALGQPPARYFASSTRQ